MAKISVILLVTLFGIAVAIPQRNLQYPTTKRPVPTTAAPATPTTAAPATTPAAPATTPAAETTTAQSAPYPAAGWRPGRAFNLPTEERKVEEPAPTYGPPADKYGPPEESTTTVQPEFDEAGNDIASDNAAAEIPQGLEPGFYFVQLPGGSIQKVALLRNAALVQLPAVTTVEGTTKAVQEKDTEGEDSAESTTASPTVNSAEHVQPIGKAENTVWPPVSVVAVQPGVVTSAKLIQPISSQQIVSAEPIVYVQPRPFSYTSEFRTW